MTVNTVNIPPRRLVGSENTRFFLLRANVFRPLARFRANVQDQAYLETFGSKRSLRRVAGMPGRGMDTRPTPASLLAAS